MAHGFGLVGGILLFAAALVSAIVAIGDYAAGHPTPTGPITASVILFVLGGLVLFFAYLGQGAWRDRPITTGILLVVLGAISWGVFGLGANVIALVGAILILVAGILYLIEPATNLVRNTATS